MKTNKTGRVCKPKAISMTPELEKMAAEQVRDLAPWVRGFSHYVQLLIRLDKKNGTLKNSMGTFTLPKGCPAFSAPLLQVV